METTTPFLTLGDDRLTRDELTAEIRAEAAIFTALGVRAGSTVAMQAPPSFTQVVALLALWQLDAQVQLLDHRLKPAEVAVLHAMSRPQFTVRATSAGRGALAARARHELLTAARSDGRPAGTPHRLVQYSSGSTGVPKAVGRTAASLRAEVDRFAALPGLPGPGDRVLLLSSTVHSFGLVAGLLHSLHAGIEVVFTPRVSARDILATAERHRVHAIFGVPFHYELLAGAVSVPALPELRVAVSGGEIMPPEVAERFADRFGVAVGESYGTTETGVIAMDVSGARRPAVGPPAPGLTVRVRDGELEVRLDESPYLHGPDGDRYAGGWFRTRDRAVLDPDSGVRLFGRADSLVVIGGLKVDLTEVEAALTAHPDVDDAVLVHVDTIEAYVATRAGTLTAGDLLRWCRDRLADHKIPKIVHVLPALPRTANGKLVREPARLRAAAA
jgi:acyl-coenzyme A synthetase/AMP-(fatty) acid ligase